MDNYNFDYNFAEELEDMRYERTFYREQAWRFRKALEFYAQGGNDSGTLASEALEENVRPASVQVKIREGPQT